VDDGAACIMLVGGNDVLLLGGLVKAVRRDVGRVVVERTRSAFASVLQWPPVAYFFVVVVVVRTVFIVVRTAVGVVRTAVGDVHLLRLTAATSVLFVFGTDDWTVSYSLPSSSI
jgi:hypothetical protein